MRKHVIALVFILLCCLACHVAQAASPAEDFEYVVGEESVSITKYIGADIHVEVPAEIEGLPVTAVKLGFGPGEYEMTSFTYVKSVKLPDTVVVLSDYAFARYSGLTSVEGLENIEHIGENAFNECPVNPVFSAKLQTAHYLAFSSSKMTSVTIPDDLQNADEYNGTRWGYSSRILNAGRLETVNLIDGDEDALIKVENRMVLSVDGKKLYNVLSSFDNATCTIPCGTESVETYAFSYASLVEEIVFPASVTQISSDALTFSKVTTAIVPADSYAATWFAGRDGYTVLVDGVDNVQSVQQMAAEVVAATITSDMTDVQKARALHDWLCANAVYDDTYTYYDATGIFRYGTGVCDAYTKAYKMLLEAAGIQSRRITCQVQGVGHAVNAVLLDGSWVYVDVTNDDGDAIGAPDSLFGFDDRVFAQLYSGSTGVTADTCRYYAPYLRGELTAALATYTAAVQAQLDAGVFVFSVDSREAELTNDLWIAACVSLLQEQSWQTGGKEVTLFFDYENGLIQVSTETAGEYTYETFGDGVCLTGWSGAGPEVTVPSAVDGMTVLALRATFRDREDLTKVTLPDTLVQIGQSAFANCINLQTVNIPSSVTAIGSSAFWKCLSLNIDLILPEGLTSMGASAFTSCVSLKTVSIPSTLREIPDQAFFSCNGLEKLTIAEGVAVIGQEAFIRCGKLRGVTLPQSMEIVNSQAFEDCGLTAFHVPDNLTQIDPSALRSCYDLTSLTVSAENTAYISQDGMLLSRDGTRLVMGTNAIPSDLTIPSTVTVIGERAFRYNLDLQSVHIPSSVLEIEEQAFFDCQKLRKVYMEDGCTSLGVYSFGFSGNSGCLEELRLSDRITHIGEEAFRASIGLNYLRLPADLTRLDAPIVTLPCAFYVHENMTYIADQQVSIDVYGRAGTFAQTYAEESGNNFIESEPFDVFNTEFSYYDWEDGVCLNYYAGSETEVVIPATINGRTVRSINKLFTSNKEITAVTLPDTLVDIGYYAFGHCSALTSINFPDSLRSIGDSAFYCCKNLAVEVVLPEGFESIGEDAFSHTGVTRVVLPSTLAEVSGSAFASCSSLQEVIMRDGLMHICVSAFNWCEQLKQVSLPATLMSIGATAFSGCELLEELVISDSVTEIGQNAFYWCSALTIHCGPMSAAHIHAYEQGISRVLISDSIYALPGQLLTIDEEAFSGTAAEMVIIPEGCQAIMAGAFTDCEGLKCVQVPASVQQIEEGAFDAHVVLIVPSDSYAQSWAIGSEWTHMVE